MRYRDYLDEAALRRYASALNWRAREAGISGVVTADALRGVILDCGGVCNWCGSPVLDVEFEIDHVLSVVRGGPNTADNLALACPACNKRKAGKHPARYAAEMLAEGAAETEFLRGVMARYGGDDPGAQLGLFDAPDDDAPPVNLAADEDDDAPVEPYVW